MSAFISKAGPILCSIAFLISFVALLLCKDNDPPAKPIRLGLTAVIMLLLLLLRLLGEIT